MWFKYVLLVVLVLSFITHLCRLAGYQWAFSYNKGYCMADATVDVLLIIGVLYCV